MKKTYNPVCFNMLDVGRKEELEKLSLQMSLYQQNLFQRHWTMSRAMKVLSVTGHLGLEDGSLSSWCSSMNTWAWMQVPSTHPCRSQKLAEYICNLSSGWMGVSSDRKILQLVIQSSHYWQYSVRDPASKTDHKTNKWKTKVESYQDIWCLTGFYTHVQTWMHVFA